jgi:hypothetical protein
MKRVYVGVIYRALALGNKASCLTVPNRVVIQGRIFAWPTISHIDL